MHRSVRDLRELICVSRLTCRDSDDEDSLEYNTNQNNEEDLSDVKKQSSNSDSSRESSASSVSLTTCVSPASDSGIVTSSESPFNSTTNVAINANLKEECIKTESVALSKKSNKVKKKTKPQVITQKLPIRTEIHKKFVPLPPVTAKKANNNLVQRNETATETNDIICKMLQCADMDIISDWLKQANSGVSNMSIWCTTGDNYVRFAQFWLSMFSVADQQEIFSLEYNLLIDQLTFVFDCNRSKFTQNDFALFMAMVFREYPKKLLSSKSNFLFLEYLDILCDRRESFRKLLSDVKYSTTVKEHIQCILAIRSYAIISIWEAVIKFFRNLSSSPEFPLQPLSARTFADPRTTEDKLAIRIEQAIRLNFIEVLRYYLNSGRIKPDYHDNHKRTLICLAVVHSQPAMLEFLLADPKIAATVNIPSDSGNTPLHVATNAGDLQLVSLLLSSKSIAVNILNKQCDSASPLHMAVMHGHAEIAKALIAAGANIETRMGQMTLTEIAEAFEHPQIFELLQSIRLQ